MTNEKKGTKKGMFIFLCIVGFIFSFGVGVVYKLTYNPTHGKYKVNWTDEIGKTYSDISYGDNEANKFDLYVPADKSKESYGLVVYLHAGGFTSGDKTDDKELLQYYASKGYVTAGINYTLRNDENEKSVYTQSMEIKVAIPVVIEEAKKLGYNIDEMVVSGGSAGGCLALIYGYRDTLDSPVPVKMVFEAVGPSSFYPEDWKNYGLDKDLEAAAGLFSVMTGQKITKDSFENIEEYDELVKDTSALYWVNENTVPTVMAYGKHDTFQPFEASKKLDEKLSKYNVDHKYFVLEHSGHGLQNDNKVYMEYMDTVEEYLNKYMPVK